MKSFIKYILATTLVFEGATYVWKNINSNNPDIVSDESVEEVVTTPKIKNAQKINRAPASIEVTQEIKGTAVPSLTESEEEGIIQKVAPASSAVSAPKYQRNGPSKSTSPKTYKDQNFTHAPSPLPSTAHTPSISSLSGISSVPPTPTPTPAQTTIKSSDSTTSNSNTNQPATTIIASKTDGTYTASISVALSFSNTASGTIYYCGTCGCDPKSSPSPYTAPVTLGTVPGIACMNYYGTLNDTTETDVGNLRITVVTPDVRSNVVADTSTYTAPKTVSLSGTPTTSLDLVTITSLKYCKATGPSCYCNPKVTSTLYNGPFTVGSASGGEACTFFYGITSDGRETAVHQIQVSVPLAAVSVSCDMVPGTYTNPASLGFTYFSNGVADPGGGDIYYCVDDTTPGAPCCNPTNAANATLTHAWTATVTIGHGGDGTYCVSYYAVADGGSPSSSVGTCTATINSALPIPPQVATDTMVVQTTEKYSLQFTMDNDPLVSAGQYLSFYRLDSTQLANSGSNCNTIVHDYISLDLDGNGTPDTIDFVSYLMSVLDVLVYGSPTHPLALNYTDTNYIVSVITQTNVDTNVNSCAITPIIMQDFEVFSDMPAYRVPASDTSGSTLMGGFSPYGYFEGTETATGTPAGKGRSDGLRSDFMNIIH